jgi:crotonobetainyl-CoA:carnitine CoA-transferase CaiB-like acyl-CoA transferase
LLTGGIAAYQTYLAKDGAPMALAALEPKFWTAFALAVGLEPDPSALVPGPHQESWKRRVSEVIASRTRAEWEAFAADVDVCLEPVLGPEELSSDPHIVARGALFTMSVDGAEVPGLRTPVTPRNLEHRPAAPAGRDTRAILREAGLDDATLDALCAAHAIG